MPEEYDELYTQSSKRILESIKGLLRENNVEFQEYHHSATISSEESTQARNHKLEEGAKAMIVKITVKTEETFKLFVLCANRKISFKKIKNKFGVKDACLASVADLRKLTGLLPGSVPPYGHPILPLELYIDESILKQERVFYNAGSLTDSISVKIEDYLRVAKGDCFDFSL